MVVRQVRRLHLELLDDRLLLSATPSDLATPRPALSISGGASSSTTIANTGTTLSASSTNAAALAYEPAGNFVLRPGTGTGDEHDRPDDQVVRNADGLSEQVHVRGSCSAPPGAIRFLGRAK
jgi:hypothetical protein